MLLSVLFISCTKSGALTGTTTSSGSFSNNVTGTVNGGLSPVIGATVALYITGNATPLASATTSSSGAFSLAYTSPGSGLLYLAASGGNTGSQSTNSNLQLLSILGSGANAPTSILINEMTTAAFMNVSYNYGGVRDSGGAVTFTSVNAAGNSNMIAQYNNLITNGSSNASLSASNQNILGAMANAVAACVEIPANCSVLFNNAPSATQSAATGIYDALFNIISANPINITNLYNLGRTVQSSTGIVTAGSNASLLNTQPIVTTNTFSGSFNGPIAVAIDASGNAWIPNLSGTTVVELNSSGTVLGTTAVGSGPAGIAIDASGNVWVTANNNLVELNSQGTVIGTFSAAGANRVAIDSTGNLWVIGTQGLKFNSSGTQLLSFSKDSNAVDIAIDPSGNVWITNYNSGTVSEFNPAGQPLNTFATSVGFDRGIAFDSSGNAWISYSTGSQVTKITPAGVQSNISAGSSLSRAIEIDAAGKLWINSQSSNKLIEMNMTGTVAFSYSTGSGSQPESEAIDASGNVWSANESNNTVSIILGVTVGPQFFPVTGPVFSGAQL